MHKPHLVEVSDIVDIDLNNSRVKLVDGREVPHNRISVLANTSIEPEFVGVPYSGTESAADMPKTVEVPTGKWIDRPA